VNSLLFVFVTSFVIGLSGAMMPGPVLVATINRSARMGFRAGPLIVLGHGIIEVSLVIGIMLGAGRILQRPVVMNPLMLCGGAVLVLLGISILNDARRGLAVIPSAPAKSSYKTQESMARPVLDGIVTSASNPYWSLWWATVGLSYIAYSGNLGPLGVPVFYSGHILSDLSWFSLVSGGVAMGTRYMTNSVYKGILVACSIVLILIGAYFSVAGGTALLAMG